MSKGKEFPPRVADCGYVGLTREPQDKCGKCVPYLSFEEHSHLLAEARRQARVGAFREADALIANEFLADQSTIRREAARRARNVLKARAAKASEGVSDE